MDMLGVGYGGDDRYNVAPTQNLPVFREVDGVLQAVEMRWWLTPYWSKEVSTKYSMFNAKSETLAQSRAFREPFARRRCVVPIAGFYEWAKTDTGKQPYYIHAADDHGLMLAGIWDRWRGHDTTIESFAIITTPVHEKLKFVHTRQPVMLSREESRRWLDPNAEKDVLAALLTTHLPNALEVVPVSTFVNNARNDGDRCIEPVADPLLLTRTD